MSGESLKRIIYQHNITLIELSKRLGISGQSLNQILNAADVKSGFIERVSKALGVSIASIYGETSSIEGDVIEQLGGTGNIGKQVNAPADYSALLKEIELLRQQFEELKEEKAQYWEMIKQLTAK